MSKISCAVNIAFRVPKATVRTVREYYPNLHLDWNDKKAKEVDDLEKPILDQWNPLEENKNKSKIRDIYKQYLLEHGWEELETEDRVSCD
ncbi:hypothetical protein DdX_15462 [Ditylenchus destructor]|uniref:Uncharacterized protein n=1 Tax=Ditylenchus destructor TaxID=166010 RepID=A0AAD4MQ90_9BILA|nr:hypothetical protein DdX_15462 [Ditylenchus destructor]